MTTTSLNRQARRAQKRQELERERYVLIGLLKANIEHADGLSACEYAKEHLSFLESLEPTSDFKTYTDYITCAKRFMRNFNIPCITD